MPYKTPAAKRAYNQQYRVGKNEETNTRHRKYRKENREKCLAAERRYRAKNRDEINRKRLEYAKKNPEKIKAYSAKYRARSRFRLALRASEQSSKKYGFVPCSETEEYIASRFTGRCHNPNCSYRESAETPKKLVLDHCHKTGTFRGWLCSKCNLALGHARDSESHLFGLIKYLKAADRCTTGT